jgi:hypothetical protein
MDTEKETRIQELLELRLRKWRDIERAEKKIEQLEDEVIEHENVVASINRQLEELNR